MVVNKKIFKKVICNEKFSFDKYKRFKENFECFNVKLEYQKLSYLDRKIKN